MSVSAGIKNAVTNRSDQKPTLHKYRMKIRTRHDDKIHKNHFEEMQISELILRDWQKKY